MPITDDQVNFLNEANDQDSSFLTTQYAADTSPQESIKNLERASYYNVNPDTYGALKADLDPQYETSKRTPAVVHPSVTKVQSQSKEHANATKEDTGILSAVGDIADHVVYNVSGRDELDKKINDLTDLDFAGELNDEGIAELDRLLGERNKREERFEDMSFIEKLPGNVGKAIDDMLGGIKEHSGKIATAGGIGALYGAAGGSVALPIIGTGAGAASVGAIALGNATVAAMTATAYQQTVNDTWLMLRAGVKDDDGNLIELTREQKVNISRAVGASAGLFEFAGGKILGSTLGKVAKRKAILELIKKPASRVALLNLGKQTGIAAASSGTEEVLAEIASVGGEVYAKNINEEMGTTFEDFVNTLAEPETLQRFAETFAVGAATGTTVTGSVGTLGIRGQIKNINADNAKVKALAKKFDVPAEDLAQNIRDYQTQQVNLEKVDKILTAKKSLEAIARVQEETLISKMSPEQAREINNQIIQDAGLTDFYFTESDLEVIQSNNPELYQQILEFDQSRSNIDQTESGVVIEPAQMVDLVKENPTITEWVRLNPEDPNPLQAENYVERMKQNAPRRQELLRKLRVDKELSPEDTQLLQELDQEVLDPTFERGKEGYEKGVELFNKEVKESLTERQVEIYEKAQKNTRENVSELVEEAFIQEEVNLANRVMRANEKIELENDRVKDAEEIAITNRFIKKKDRIDVAIDPLFLPDDLREAYVNDPVLKKRKVFRKGGLRPEESAFLVGVDDWREMLKIIANSKTVRERAEARTKRLQKIEEEMLDVRSKGLDERLDKKFDNENRLRHMEMEYLRTKDPTTLKRGVKMVVLPLSKLVGKMNEKANRVIRKTKVGKLQVTQYNNAARAHQRRSMNHIFNNEVPQAFESKEKSILNNEMTREAYRAKKAVNQARSFIRNVLLNKKNVANLKKSGLWKQVDDILSLYNLEGTGSKNAAKQENYNNFVKQMAEQGIEFEIPEHLNDIRERGDNLTVEQFLAITERLQMINQQSKLKNKLLNKIKLKEKQAALDDIHRAGKALAEGLEKHSNYDETRSQESTLRGAPKDAKEQLSEFVNAAKAGLTNLKNIMLEADDELLGGDNQNAIAQRMVDSRDKKRTYNKIIKDQIKKISEDYGVEEFGKAFTETLDIPQFRNYKALGYGKLTKSHLWRLLMYKGDPDGLARITNFVDQDGNNISMDTINEVLETYLTEQDGKTVQNFTNIFKSFEDEALALHERTTGVKATRIKGVPIEHKGRVLDGGYASLAMLRSNIDAIIKRNHDLLGDSPVGEQNNEIYSRRRAAEQTEQGRFKERQTSSKLELDLNFMEVIKSYEEHIHDISYREAGMDTLKLLREPNYQKALINTVGNNKYEAAVNAIIETVGKDTDIVIDANLASQFTKVFNHIKTGVVTGLLGANPTSILMQPLSFSAAILRMDKGGKKHLAKSIGKTLSSLGKRDYQQVFDRANSIDENIGRSIEAIEDLLPSTLADEIPTSGSKLIKVRNKVKDLSLYGLKHADVHIKVAVTNAAYDQFVNGDVKGFDETKLATMSPEQIHQKAKNYAKQVSDLALTTSEKIDKIRLEKYAAMKLFTMFFTDVRQQVNTGFSEYRKIKKGIKQKNYQEATRAAVSLMAMNMLIDIYTSSLYGSDDNPLKELYNADDLGDVGNTFASMMFKSLSAPIRSMPLIRDVAYAAESDRKIKNVRTISGKVMGDVATSYEALATLASLEGLNAKQTEALLYTFNYASGGGVPINGIKKTLKFFGGDLNDIFTFPFEAAGAGIVGSAGLVADVYRGAIDSAKETNNPALIGAAEEFEQQLPQTAKEIKIPENALSSLAIAEDDFLDPETGAAGKFQFTQREWDRIAEAHPDLELTDDGRTDINNTEEQELAMYQNMEDSAEILTEYDLPVNNKTLYGSHKFGVNNYALILLSDGKERLKDIGVDMTMFEGFETVKSVKDFVNKTIKD